MRKLLFFTVLSCFVFFESEAQYYLGGSLGNSFINTDLNQIDGDSFKYNGNSFGWKVFAGVGMMKFLGIEGGYRDLGEIKSDSDGNTYIKTNGGDVALRANVNIGPVVVFGKGGAFFASQKSDEIGWSDNSTNFLWGVGAGLNLGDFGVRLEYESLGMHSNNNLSMLTVGASFQFGKKVK